MSGGAGANTRLGGAHALAAVCVQGRGRAGATRAHTLYQTMHPHSTTPFSGCVNKHKGSNWVCVCVAVCVVSRSRRYFYLTVAFIEMSRASMPVLTMFALWVTGGCG